jgi:CRISPR/Cas system-associated exonuclease Cas4 (RecB family)
MLLAVALLLLLVGIGLVLAARWLRRRTQLPAGSLLASDAGAEPGRLLVSSRYQLQGRPDYLIRQGRQVIPVELKPGQARAYPSAIMQLMAYCLLVEEHDGRPGHGLLVTRDGAQSIAYTDARRANLLTVLAAMRAAPLVPARNHQQAARCRACRFAPICSEALDATGHDPE